MVGSKLNISPHRLYVLRFISKCSFHWNMLIPSFLSRLTILDCEISTSLKPQLLWLLCMFELGYLYSKLFIIKISMRKLKKLVTFSNLIKNKHALILLRVRLLYLRRKKFIFPWNILVIRFLYFVFIGRFYTTIQRLGYNALWRKENTSSV